MAAAITPSSAECANTHLVICASRPRRRRNAAPTVGRGAADLATAPHVHSFNRPFRLDLRPGYDVAHDPHIACRCMWPSARQAYPPHAGSLVGSHLGHWLQQYLNRYIHKGVRRRRARHFANWVDWGPHHAKLRPNRRARYVYTIKYITRRFVFAIKRGEQPGL